MKLRLALWISAATVALAYSAEQTNQPPDVLIVVGAPGEPRFGETFEKSARLWEKACQQGGAQATTIGLSASDATNDLHRIKSFLRQETRETSSELWLVLLGHGTFDGKEAKFNLRGPDLSASDLADCLKPMRRPIAVIDTTASSSPFLAKLSAPGRVIITATRSGYEQNYARFGQFLSADISDPKADLDKDGQVSLLEAFLMAAHDVAEFYKTQGRLATEHALIDDNGDGRGTPPDWFRGVRAVKKASDGSGVDGLRAHQWHLIPSEAERRLSPALRLRRNNLELAIEQLRESKDKLQEDDYYHRLELLLVDLARLYQANEKAKP
jgi:hypothetical protein